MPKRGESKYIGQRSGRLLVIDTTYTVCRRVRGRNRRPNVSSYAVCRCDCGRTQRVQMASFRRGHRTCCEWCELVSTNGTAADRAFQESGRRIDARERAALAHVRPYRRSPDPDLFFFGRWMQ